MAQEARTAASLRKPAAAKPHAQHAGLLALALGALGVVFGDIGTSPLYTLQVGIAPEAGAAPVAADVLGVCSLIVWALFMVVTVKYLLFIMRADNHGEGGILALLALVPRENSSSSRGGAPAPPARIGFVALMVIAGAALLYGDGIITPAISVLSALEGVELAAPGFKAAVVPLTCVVLLGLFAVQSRGTGGIGKVFGPVMVCWFLAIAGLGAWHIARNPSVLVALSPTWGAHYFAAHGIKGLPILGIVVLAITGGEALYADMGHFGAPPIRFAWLFVVLPALVLCYLGQGALVLRDPTAVANPFFAMVPTGAATYGLVAISTFATIIASQSLISGVFSLTHQAVQLGFFPRVTIAHTAREAEGQIYVPEMNWGLCILSITLVLWKEESGKLAAAYGIAVSGTMAITSYVYYVVTRKTWKWPAWKALPVLLLFLAFDIPFFAANLLKFFDGGYIPIAVGLAMLTVMVDWKWGRAVLAEHIASVSPKLVDFVRDLESYHATRVPGVAIVMSSNPEGTPPVLVTQSRRIHALCEKVVLLTVEVEHVPFVEEAERVTVKELGKGLWRAVMRVGFMESPKVPDVLGRAGLPFELADATYYLGRETFLAGKAGKMGPISEGLFSFLSRNAKSATNYFGIPPEQVVELGMQIDL
jgi:KUP system potassium uptake protein